MSYFIDMKNTSRKPYIYKVTNFETHQYYIGSQCSGKTIGVNYFTSSTNKEFKEGFKTYGEEKYKIEIIKEFEDPEECVRAENYMIRNHMLLKDGLCLNRSYFCNGEKVFSRVGLHHSEEARQKMSKALKGFHPSEEARQKMSIAHKGKSPGNKGTHLPEETRKRISRALKGRPSLNKGHPSPKKGIHLSRETRKRMSEAQKNRIKISIEGTIFDSITEASKYYNVSDTAIRYWVKKNQHNSFYIEK